MRDLTRKKKVRMEKARRPAIKIVRSAQTARRSKIEIELILALSPTQPCFCLPRSAPSCGVAGVGRRPVNAKCAVSGAPTAIAS